MDSKKREEIINSIYQKMTVEEKWQLAIRRMSGTVDFQNKTVIMGTTSFQRLIGFEEEMIKKYGKL
jgi:hypothetical protein